MIWSFSHGRIFRTCQRQWFFREYVASDNPNDTLGWEVFLLSKLQSLAAWRGGIVDDTIKLDIVPALKKRWNLNRNRILENARKRFDAQLDFARHHRLREQELRPSKAGDAFAAFYALEYDQSLTNADIAQAWKDVETALTNLLSMGWLLGTLSTAQDLVPQRPLTFTLGDTTIKAIPDLIAFYAGQAPLIVDWKVHTFGTAEYRLQLLCYALALTRCNPHKDFPESLSNYAATDIRLVEAQLLTGQIRTYEVSDSDVEEVELYIFENANEMILALGEDGAGNRTAFDFPPTEFPENCQRCAFRRLCWKESLPWDLKQMSFL